MLFLRMLIKSVTSLAYLSVYGLLGKDIDKLILKIIFFIKIQSS